MILTTPTAVRRGRTFLRRGWALRWLRGENPAVAVGFLWEFFFEAAPHPLAAFDLDGGFHFTQGRFDWVWF